MAQPTSPDSTTPLKENGAPAQKEQGVEKNDDVHITTDYFTMDFYVPVGSTVPVGSNKGKAPMPPVALPSNTSCLDM